MERKKRIIICSCNMFPMNKQIYVIIKEEEDMERGKYERRVDNV
jgi:hypothetical protein